MKVNLKTISFIVLLTLTSNYFPITSTKTVSSNLFNDFNYDNNGNDWSLKFPECRTGNQSPIDIKAPFQYKSNLIR